MAVDALLKITDALFLMFPANFAGGMFVAFVAGVFFVVAGRVAGLTLNVVMPVKDEVFIMIEGRGLPLFGGVTLAALARDLTVQFIAGNLGLVAGNTLLKFGFRQNFVIEGCGLPFFAAVALPALIRGIAMKGIRRHLMAADASLAYGCINQPMGKFLETAEFGHTHVIAVTRHTVLNQKLLMKGDCGLLSLYKDTFGGCYTDIGNFVTGHAFFRSRA